MDDFEIDGYGADGDSDGDGEGDGEPGGAGDTGFTGDDSPLAVPAMTVEEMQALADRGGPTAEIWAELVELRKEREERADREKVLAKVEGDDFLDVTDPVVAEALRADVRDRLAADNKAYLAAQKQRLVGLYGSEEGLKRFEVVRTEQESLNAWLAAGPDVLSLHPMVAAEAQEAWEAERAAGTAHRIAGGTILDDLAEATRELKEIAGRHS